jgi:hypothetical protein
MLATASVFTTKIIQNTEIQILPWVLFVPLTFSKEIDEISLVSNQ